MSKFYQYLKGENRGKVTELEYIDDSDPGIILYTFKDGFRCNADLISKINDMEAFNDKKSIMAEVQNESNVWKFREKEIKQTAHAEKDEAGNNWEIPDPYFVDKTGTQINKEKKEITAVPPRKFFGEVEPDDIFYLSYKRSQPEKVVSETQEIDAETEQIKVADTTSMNFSPEQFSASDLEMPGILKIDKPLKTSIFFNLDEIDKEQKLTIQSNGEEKEFGLAEAFQHLFSDGIPEKAEEEPKEKDTVTLMIENCQTKPVKIKMDLEINLPDQSLYDTIKTSFPEGWEKKMLQKIVDKLDGEIIRTALADGLDKKYNEAYQKSHGEN